MTDFEQRFFPPGAVSQAELDVFHKQTRKVLYRKGDFVLRKGEIEPFIYYVIKGCLRQYVVDSNGKEHILMFSPENWVMADHESFIKDIPSQTFIDAIEETEVYTVPKQLMIDVWKNNMVMLSHSNSRLRIMAFDLQRRIIELMSSSAEERYLKFLSVYPHLANRIPLKMIASYLGITPESLSRVRNVLVKGPKAGKQ